jgi:hypothetical protein
MFIEKYLRQEVVTVDFWEPLDVSMDDQSTQWIIFSEDHLEYPSSAVVFGWLNLSMLPSKLDCKQKFHSKSKLVSYANKKNELPIFISYM